MVGLTCTWSQCSVICRDVTLYVEPVEVESEDGSLVAPLSAAFVTSSGSSSSLVAAASHCNGSDAGLAIERS